MTVTDLTSESVTMIAISPGDPSVTADTTTTSITSSAQSPRPSYVPTPRPGSPKPFGGFTSRISSTLKNIASQGKGSTNQQNLTSTKPLYGRQLKTLKKESRATRLLAAIIFVFISLWAPYNILVVYSTFDNNKVPPLAWNLRGLFCCS